MSELANKDWQEFIQSQDEVKQKISQDPWRLDFHLMPEIGWLNDPNGLVQFKGT